MFNESGTGRSFLMRQQWNLSEGMKLIKNRLKKLLAKINADNRVLAVFLYGSRVRGEASPKSDIDICLVTDKNALGSKDSFQIRLEYMQDFDFDMQIFSQLPIYVRVNVIKDGELLFCRNEDQLYELVFKVIREFADFEHIYRDYLEEVAHA